MKRFSLAALVSTTALLLLESVALPPVLADIPTDNTARIRQYEDQAIRIEQPASGTYVIQRGGRTIDDMDLATTSGKPELVARVNSARNLAHAYQISVGIVGIPLGLLLAADNFFGRRTGAQKVGAFVLPPSIVAPFAESNPLSYGLAVGGAALALYGAWQLGALIGEAAGWYSPSYLDPATVKAAAKGYDDKLAVDLDLSATEVAEATPEATPLPTPSPFPATFPEGETGSGCWAVRQALPVVAEHAGPTYRPYLLWTSDIHDFETGTLQSGVWHVLFAGEDTHADIDASVPLHGPISWTDANPYFTPYRAGTDLLDRVEVDSPRSLFLLKEPFVERQIGWLAPGSVVVLYPFWGRLHGPVWTVSLGAQRMPPQIGIDAEFGTLVEMAHYRI
ncbi:MAG: hypothetical protein KGR26_01685 [Cyanobacteria bacterium REEB65]|nr:hypothetical protein [Cyanobacteria bacterium REEB65]